MSDLPTLLPPNARSVERDLEQAMSRLQGLSLPVSVLWNPDLCPETLLPYLAWAMSIEIWDDTWTAKQKRATIKNSVAVHRIKGTRGAVERALMALGFNIDLSEWFETGDPVHTFRLDAFGGDVLAAGLGIDSHLFATITRVIETAKPVRSHFTLRIGEIFSISTTARSGVRQRSRHRAALVPQPAAHGIDGYLLAKTCSRQRGRMAMELLPQPTTHSVAATQVIKQCIRQRQRHCASLTVIPRAGASYAN